ncbi:restriction endonuclease subunit S [Dehalococcoides mccartyi]|uniref:Restriction endonuclease subunit S n=1 Tax=Dehalococcoides mccartyi TaxID=61435 RepID=A0AB38ZBI3_9CHLR|nr:restriction endonuclease subunit S [Dehalococcoides mccartyi]WRO07935.1 restriction endonuclease subunit S [Dehalococcoides mccartyi]
MRFLDCIEINPTIKLEKGKEYPFVEMANVDIYAREPKIVEMKKYSSGVKFQKGDTIVSRIEPCLQNGKGFYAKNINEGFGSTEFLVFRPKNEKTDNDFLYYLLLTDNIRKNMIGSMTGATGRQRVNNDIFNSLDLSLPEIEIQKRIAGMLSAYDDLIENNHKQIKLLEEAAMRLYKEWFINLRFPGYETTKIVDGVPEGWNKCNLGFYAKVKSGYAFKSSWWKQNGVPVIKIKDIQDNTVNLSQLDCVDMGNAKKAKDFSVVAGDLLIAMTGATTGKIAIVPIVDDMLVNQRVGKFFLGENPIEKLPFLYCTLQEANSYNWALNFANGSAQPNISPTQIESLEILFSDYFIGLYNEKMRPSFESIIKLRRLVEKLKQARNTMLPKLISREIEV